MSRSDNQRIDDILESSAALAEIASLGHERFSSDKFLQLAAERLIEIIGEAARQLSDTTREEFPTINWKEIIGMRTRLAHIYHRVNFENVWGAAVKDVPELAKQLSDKREK